MANSDKFIVVYDPHFSSDTPRSRTDDYPETMFGKLQYILGLAVLHSVDTVIFAGDFSHKKTQPTAYEFRMFEALQKFWAAGIRVLSIVGNHDVYAANVAHLGKTFLGVAFASGVIKHLDRAGVVLETSQGLKYRIHGWDYEPRLTVATPIERDSGVTYYMAVAHGFLCKEQGVYETEEYLDRDSFFRAGYDAMFVGHDHIEYPVVKYGDDTRSMLVARGGSLSRGTKHHYNRLRTPKVHLCHVSSEGIAISAMAIPCQTGEEIFSDHRIEREDLEKNIKKFIGQLKEPKLEQGDIFVALRQVCTNDTVLACCFQYLKEAGFVEA